MNIAWTSCGKRLLNKVVQVGSDAYEFRYSYTISQLKTTDEGKVYQCEVVINTTPPVMASGSITLDVTGKCCMFASFCLAI